MILSDESKNELTQNKDENKNELTQNNNEDVKPKQPPEDRILYSAGTGIGRVRESELLIGFVQPPELDDDDLPHKEPHYYAETGPISEGVVTEQETISDEASISEDEVTESESLSEEDPVILYETDYGQTKQEDGLGDSDTNEEKKESTTIILSQGPDVKETNEGIRTKNISIGLGIITVIGLVVWFILSRGSTPNASSLFSAWVADETYYTVQANISDLTADKVIGDQILSTFKHYIPSEYAIKADVKESGGIREVHAQYLVDGEDTNLVFINNNQGVYIQNDGLVDTIDNWLDREQTEVLNQALSNKWVDFNKFRELVEVPQDVEPLPYLYASDEQTDTEDVKELTIEEQLLAWLGSIDKENVNVDEDVTTIKVGTQDSLNFVNTLLQNTELSNFISVLEGDIVITPNSIQYKGDFEFVLYGLKFNGKLDTTLTLIDKKVNLGYDSIDVMDTKEFIGYYFGLLTRDTVKFTQDEFNIIREVILAEREHMTADERKELLKELDKELFTDEQYKELKQLLTEEIEQDSAQLSEDEIKEREERFKELQELLARKEKENEELTNAPPVTSVPVTPNRPAPSESSESESSETSEPESSEPETSQPEPSTPETSEPETSQPESSEPETSQPVESTPSSGDETGTPNPTPTPESTPETPAPETPASDSAESQNEG